VSSRPAPRTVSRLSPAATREEVIRRGRLAVAVRPTPFAVRVVRGVRSLVEGFSLWTQSGSGGDRFVQLTEGVIPEETRDEPDPLARAWVARTFASAVELSGSTRGGRPAAAELSVPDPDHLVVELRAWGEPYRLGASWALAPDERLVGLGARHGLDFDQRGRTIQLGADRRYTGPDCPPDMLDAGGIPQGDYAPAPWLVSNRGWALWIEGYGPGCELDLRDGVSVSTRATAGPLRLHLFTGRTPAARLRAYLARTGMPQLLPEWAYGHWKSRDVYEHADDVIDDLEGYLRHGIPLDAIVIDSPWETQYNTWRFNPRQFPDPSGLIGRLRTAQVRTVVWITPWINLESADGQRPPDPESDREHRKPASNYAEAEAEGHFVGRGDGRPHVGRWWMGTGSPVDLSSPAARRWWQDQARRVLELGVEGIKADDGEGYYFPPEARFADGRSGAEAAWDYGRLYREAMQEVLDEVHPGAGVLFGRSGWSGQQAIGMLWGGDQASDFWSLRALVAATLSAAASGFSNWSHDVGGYLGRRLVERCSAELLVRWAQFGCFTPLMQAHGRFEQEAWRYDPRTLEIYRAYVLLHERLVPYVRAAAATAHRTGLPIVRPLCLTDPDDPAGWRIADAYGYGPALWVAPVLEEGARERVVHLPRGEWIRAWSGELERGGRTVHVSASLEQVPVWVRAGSLIVTYPAAEVASGLGLEERRPRRLEATLWGRPRLGQAMVRLADGSAVRWRRGEWSVAPAREVEFVEIDPD
jgi:alpha-glucosidase (family GH31 glycosyl hydrolase)